MGAMLALLEHIKILEDKAEHVPLSEDELSDRMKWKQN